LAGNRTTAGKTALMAAAESNYVEAAIDLVATGLETNLELIKERAIDIAICLNHFKIVKILKDEADEYFCDSHFIELVSNS